MSLDALVAQVGELLTHHGHKTAVAESCTGGAIAAALTSLAGSSRWFERGFVVYSNDAKTEMLGVEHDTAVRHGSVSEPVALEMVNGALEYSNATIAVAATGVAGPDGGTPEKPVGTVWLAWSIRNGERRAQKMLFKGDRSQIREQSVQAALKGIIAGF